MPGITFPCSAAIRQRPSRSPGSWLCALSVLSSTGAPFAPPVHEDFRAGDVRHSQADISKAKRYLGYDPAYDVRAGLVEALPWYEARFAPEAIPPSRENENVRSRI